MKAPVTRKLRVPEVVCPCCGHVNRFADFDAIIVFICAGRGEPIEVIEPVQ